MVVDDVYRNATGHPLVLQNIFSPRRVRSSFPFREITRVLYGAYRHFEPTEYKTDDSARDDFWILARDLDRFRTNLSDFEGICLILSDFEAI